METLCWKKADCILIEDHTVNGWHSPFCKPCTGFGKGDPRWS